MKIGELAGATGLTTKTIRFYEHEGLLPEPPRTSFVHMDAFPVEPPPEIDLTVDPVGGFDPRSGVATLSGTFLCEVAADFIEVDGELVEWKAGDMMLRPIKPQGVAHRHFQRSKEPAKWLAILYVPMWDHIGSDMTQMELSPEFKEAFGG